MFIDKLLIDYNLGGGSVVVCDINKSMLGVGEDRAVERGYQDNKIQWVEGDAQVCPFEIF